MWLRVFFCVILTLLSLSFVVAVWILLQPAETPFTQRLTQVNALAVPTQAPFIPTTPSLDQIFADEHGWIATLSADRLRVLIATGDVIPARSVNIQTVQRNNFLWPVEMTAEYLRNADITFINLETPLLQQCPLHNEGFTFCGDAKHSDGLVYAGIDIASLANNHAGNYGLAGILETTQLLQSQGIQVTGRAGPVYEMVRGKTFAFLGYNDIGYTPVGLSRAEEITIRSDIAEARGHADIVVVMYHWGTEYRSQPDDRQQYLGHLTIDAGADLVIGNHPHWIQPIEFYHGKLITYAHGNFIFDQEWSLKTKQGVIGRYTFYDDTLIDVSYSPIQIENYGQPRFLTGLERRALLDEMQSRSIQ